MTALEVLYCDNHLVVVDKPACVPTVPDDSGDESLFDQAKAYVKERFEKPGDTFLGVVHRLDRPVSGVVVFARTSKAAARLTAQFKERTVRKLYWGVAARLPDVRWGLVEQWLVKDQRKNRALVVTSDRPGAKRAVTEWRLLESEGGRALMELRPHTGRPHQLRVASVELAGPLLGDLRYGAAEPLEDRSVALHARLVELDHPTRRERHTFESPPPALDVWSFDLCREARAGGRRASAEEMP